MIKVQVFGSGSAGNGYLIDDGQSQLILETGVPFKRVQQMVGHDFARVAGILVTHEHRDHCKYIKSFIDGTTADIYATAGTIDAMYQDDVLKLKILNKYRFKSVNYRQTYIIGTWRVTPFETKHDVAEPCGFLIDNTAGDRLVFITDSYYVKYTFPKVTHMMIEANYADDIIESKLSSDKFSQQLKTRIKGSHFDLANTIEFVQKNRGKHLQEIYLIHLSDSNSNAQQFKQAIQQVSGVPVYIA
ncbi:MBL fold metallo-hydrolase [Enterococcus saccharolyticus]|uniref:MBL fold metallo-hydrolase n=1 Tax=Enterococcus saccharolyticus TaxID=41997 RepID=UPI001E48E471|nr:MBL fold metallo-hydrolase [Enterococcus saccharolyticus]MCD5001210.1 MBL fold metallo-hydrolase [Enterococcus saccharolyticus]